MKYYKNVYSMLFLSLLIFSCSNQNQQNNDDNNELMITFEDSLSYAIGINIGKNLPNSNLNDKLVFEGLNDFFSMSEPKLNVAERDQLLRELNIRLSNIEREQMASLTLKNKELSRNNKMAGQEFLEKNKLREGVRVLQRSGIQYKSIVTGNGPVSDFNDTVVVHYNGYLIDGTKFDSSYDRDEPITMSIDKFIEGWQKILSIMPVGSKWEVFIPHNLAYGESGVGGPDDHVIPPGSTLVFEMELIEIVD